MKRPMAKVLNVIIVYLVGMALQSTTLLASQVAQPSMARPYCLEKCGNVTIPFPFGVGSKCSIDKWFDIECDNSTDPPTPNLKLTKLQVLNISLGARYHYYSDSRQFLTVKSPISYFTCSGKRNHEAVNLTDSPFHISSSNTFVAASCGVLTVIDTSYGDEFSETGCKSTCSTNDSGVVASTPLCSGIDCCERNIDSYIPDSYKISLKGNTTTMNNHDDGCKFAFLVDGEYWYKYKNQSKSLTEIRKMDFVPISIDWVLNYSYFDLFGTKIESNKMYGCYARPFDPMAVLTSECFCNGFNGNPYLIDGCSQDINECEEYPHWCDRGGTCVNTFGSVHCSYRRKYLIIGFGSAFGALILLFGLWGSYKLIKKLKEKKRKKKFFKQNGGLLLQQQMSSDEGNVKKTKVFTSSELSKATDHFSVERVLGQGGQGTVYKGMLEDGSIVAIKKSNVVDEEKLSEFINEVVILSQINHRNVVQLLGCCLETEVPILVYEFIPNGTLSQYIHVRNEEFLFTWKMRLRIATDIAGALSYLHSAASFPIYHRDIKSTNILLDEKYKAKVADFGTSRTISIEQSHLTTLVYGTLGYLDPEYFQSSQFTDKSDVYSFGVVLVELLTGQKAICTNRAEEGRNLATYFIMSMEDDALFDILDPQVLEDGAREEITVVASLALMCLRLNGRNRPTMKDVAMELEGLQKAERLETLSGAQASNEEAEFVGMESISAWESSFTATGSALGSANHSSMHQELPLLSFNDNQGE